MMEYYQILERVVLEQLPELVIYTKKIQNNLIEEPKTAIIEIAREELERIYNVKFSKKSDYWIKVRVKPEMFNVYSGKIYWNREWRTISDKCSVKSLILEDESVFCEADGVLV